ncbi:hypothetical protein D0T25_20645 [Duganella sp. BJB488]|nr:hypothetical protein D0T25_20645 [Duganella sp. BJB488]
MTWNIDYGMYCRARAAVDETTCKQLEAKFPGIADIYTDFDELDKWPEDGLQSEQWRNWFEPRRELFMPQIGEVITPTEHVAKQGHVLLDLPLLANQADTEELVQQYLKSYYAKPGFIPAAAPKYNLHLTDGKLALNLKEVRQACVSAEHSYAYFSDDADEIGFKKAVTEFVRHHIDDMGWSLDEKARKLLDEKHRLSDENHSSFAARLTRSRRHFVALCRNAIRGRFPDVSEFDSLVLKKF